MIATIVIVLVLYFGSMVAIGFMGRDKASNFEGYLSMGRSAGVLLLMGGAIGAQIGNGFVVGGAAEGASVGMAGCAYGLACAFSLLVTAFLLNDFIYKGGYMSMTDYTRQRYHNEIPGVIYDLSSAISSIGLAAGQIMAGKALFEALGLPGNVGAIAIAVVVLLNKWDLVDTAERREKLENDVAERLHFVSYDPVVRISALTGRSCLRVWDAVNTADAHRRQVIPTPQLNKLLTELREFGHTVTKGTKRLKMNYITQTGNKPPIFTIFVNMPELVTPNYEHFLENRIRDRFDLTGTPIRFKFKKKAM